MDNLPETPQVTYKAACVDLAHNQCFQQVQEDMSKGRSVCKDWGFGTLSW